MARIKEKKHRIMEESEELRAVNSSLESFFDHGAGAFDQLRIFGLLTRADLSEAAGPGPSV